MYVFDATPLIYLASVERLELATALDAECCLPERVYEEVVTTGIESGHADARRVQRAIDEDVFAVESCPDTDLTQRLTELESLSDADVAVLALAATVDGIAVMDEQYGRSIADAEGIPTRGTAYVVLSAQQAGLIDASETRTVVDQLLEEGWYCAPDLYAAIRSKIDDIER
ncbi:MAG: DUF3368 domain-containing protein [Haloarculaceae archaeon]